MKQQLLSLENREENLATGFKSLQKLLVCGPQPWRAGLCSRTKSFKKLRFSMKKNFRTAQTEVGCVI